jgi:serine/threonine protein kinase
MKDFPEIPRYKISGKLGKGSIARVFLAIQDKLNRKLAIKVLDSQLLKDKDTAARFDKETKTAASLSHANIVRILDTGKTNKYYYIVMEYLEDSLKDMMNRNPQLNMPPEIALDIVDNIMKALDYTHLMGIYHRDIKPENIMFRPDRTPLLVDFGLARAFDPPEPQTKSDHGIGAAYYLSPEQCLGHIAVDGRSDIYSLGVVLFEMLTGKKPYDGETWASIARQHIEAPVPKLPEESSLYQPLLDKMMAKDRENRLSNRSEFTTILEEILSSLATSSQQPEELTPPEQKTRQPEQKTMPKEFTFKKPTNPILTQLNSYVNSMKSKLDPIMNKPIMKKLLLGVLPALIILVFLSIIIFNQGYQSPTEQSTQSQSPGPFLFIKEIFDQVPGYHAKLNRARELFNRGDFDSLVYADRLIKELKEIAITPEANDLGKMITQQIEMLDMEFQTYFDAVTEYYMKNNYKKAKEFILKAKQIKPADKDILELERLIEKETRKR